MAGLGCAVRTGAQNSCLRRRRQAAAKAQRRTCPRLRQSAHVATFNTFDFQLGAVAPPQLVLAGVPTTPTQPHHHDGILGCQPRRAALDEAAPQATLPTTHNAHYVRCRHPPPPPPPRQLTCWGWGWARSISSQRSLQSAREQGRVMDPCEGQGAFCVGDCGQPSSRLDNLRLA